LIVLAKSLIINVRLTETKSVSNWIVKIKGGSLISYSFLHSSAELSSSFHNVSKRKSVGTGAITGGDEALLASPFDFMTNE